MPDVLNRRNALLGWLVWNLAKRRLRKKLHADGEAPSRRRVFRGIVAVAVLAGIAGVLAKRALGPDDTAE